MSQTTNAIRVGLKLSRDAPIETFRRVWEIADLAGFDHCWAFDHIASLAPDGANLVVFEGWTLLGAMAAATRRTRIGLLVSGMVYRHPALLAKAAVTVDHLSGGRLEFGVGAGWADVEHQMFGFEQTRLVDRFSEGLEVIELLWTGKEVNYSGSYYQLRQAVAIPQPVQQPHPPIWMGAGGPRMLSLAARHADVWNPASGGLEEATAGGQQLQAECRKIGRDPALIRWAVQQSFDGTNPSAVLKEIARWHSAGFVEFVISCSAYPVRSAEIAAEQLLPRIRQLGLGE